MGKFVAVERVERIEWDFTDVPKHGGSKNAVVSGEHVTGTVVEPDLDTAAAFSEAYEAIIQTALRSKDASVDRLTAAANGEDVDPLQVGEEALTAKGAYVALHSQAMDALKLLGVPDALLKQLPPRHVSAFLSYVAGELQGEGAAA